MCNAYSAGFLSFTQFHFTFYFTTLTNKLLFICKKKKSIKLYLSIDISTSKRYSLVALNFGPLSFDFLLRFSFFNIIFVDDDSVAEEILAEDAVLKSETIL